MSSLKSVPPVDTMHSTFRYFPISMITEETCKASSRVGTRIRDWMSLFASSSISRMGIA